MSAYMNKPKKNTGTMDMPNGTPKTTSKNASLPNSKISKPETNVNPKDGSNGTPPDDIDTEWKAKGKEYGTYEKANTPKKTDENTKVNKALDTATSEKRGKEGIVQDERVKQNIKRSVLEQEVGFTSRSQQDALGYMIRRKWRVV